MRLEDIIASTLGMEHCDLTIPESDFLLEDLDTKQLDCGMEEDLDGIRYEPEGFKSLEEEEEIVDEEEELDLSDFIS